MKEHTLTFDQAGNVSVDAVGYVGRACEDVTKRLMRGMGADKTSERKKPEFHQAVSGKSGATQRA